MEFDSHFDAAPVVRAPGGSPRGRAAHGRSPDASGEVARLASGRALRLLFVSHSLPPEDRPLENVGGMQRVATKLHEALTARPEPTGGLLLRSTWRMTHLKTGPFLAKALWRILRLVQHDAIDAVLFSSMVTATLALPLGGFLRRHGVAAAAIVHGRDVTLPVAPWQWLVPKVFGALDAVLPVSRATGAACTARGLPEAKLHVVPNGIDTDRFASPASRPAMRRALTDALGDPAHPLPDDALLLCSVGRQVERKGFAWFIDRVMPRLPADVHYWLAGDGPQAEAIASAVERHGLHPRVRLLGRVSEDDLARLYRGADLFVMPNVPVVGDMEGFGIVMLEAGQNGCPVVAARLEGIQDVVTEGVNGHLVPTGDAGAFADRILRYRHAPERLRRASARAYRHITDHFGWPAVARRYVEVMASVTRARAAHAAPMTTHIADDPSHCG
jgi:phosphatidylinositol alpha-1,6-mannosyltransferase